MEGRPLRGRISSWSGAGRRTEGLTTLQEKMETESGGSGARVVIGGGGVAGLEALLALSDLAGERAQLTLLAPEPEFVYKPLLVEEPFDLGPAERHELAPLAEEVGASFALRAASAVEPEQHRLVLDDGS